MLEIIALVSVASWFAKTARASGRNPVGWVLVGLASYFAAEFGVVFAIRDAIASMFMASPTDASGALLATISTAGLGITAGILACSLVASALTSRAVAQER